MLADVQGVQSTNPATRVPQGGTAGGLGPPSVGMAGRRTFLKNLISKVVCPMFGHPVQSSENKILNFALNYG